VRWFEGSKSSRDELKRRAWSGAFLGEAASGQPLDERLRGPRQNVQSEHSDPEAGRERLVRVLRPSHHAR